MEPGTLELWDLLCVHCHAFLAQLTWQVLIEVYLFHFCLRAIDFWT